MSYAERLGVAMRAHRTIKGLSLQEASDLIEVGYKDLIRLENGSDNRIVSPSVARRFADRVAVDRVLFEEMYREYVFERSWVCPDTVDSMGELRELIADYDRGWDPGGEGISSPEVIGEHYLKRRSELQSLAVRLLYAGGANAIRAAHTVSHWAMVRGDPKTAYGVARETRSWARELSSDAAEGWSLLRQAICSRYLEPDNIEFALGDFAKAEAFIKARDEVLMGEEGGQVLIHTFYRERLATLVNASLRRPFGEVSNPSWRRMVTKDLAAMERVWPKMVREKRRARGGHVEFEASIVFDGYIPDANALEMPFHSAGDLTSIPIRFSLYRMLALGYSARRDWTKADEMLRLGGELADRHGFGSARKFLEIIRRWRPES